MSLHHHKGLFGPDGEVLSAFAYLLGEACWLPARKVPVPGQPGKFKKPPVVPSTGRGNGYTEPGAAVTYAEALAYAEARGLHYVGLEMAAVRRAGFNIVGVDLDGAIGADGKPKDWARSILTAAGKLQTYVERSPSGTGYRILCEGTGAAVGKDTEVYDGSSGRFLTITGDRKKVWPSDIVAAPETVNAALARVKAYPRTAEASTRATAASQGRGKVAQRDLTPINAVNGIAMASLDAWVPQRFPEARREADGSYRVAAEHLPGHEGLTEDLSIDPAGIVDFGLADQDGETRAGKRSPVDCYLSPYTDIIDPMEGAAALATDLGLGAVLGGLLRQVAGDWPILGDLGDVDLPPAGVWPRRALGATLDRLALNIAARTGGEGDAARGFMLLWSGALTPRCIVFRPRGAPDWTMPASFFAAIVGNPSSTKSPMTKAIKKPALAVEAEKTRRHEREVARFMAAQGEAREAAKAIRRHEAQKARRKAKAGGATEEAPDTEAVAVEPPAMPHKPLDRTRIITSGTPQGIVKMIAESGDSGIYAPDELAVFLGGLDRYNSGGATGGQDRGFWLTAYDGDVHSARLADASRNVTGVYVVASVFGSVQPDKLGPLIPVLADDGLLQRFLLLPVGDGRMSSDVPADTSGAAHWEKVTRLVMGLGVGDMGAETVLSADAGATAVSREAERWAIEQREEWGHDKVALGVLGKTRGTVARITLAVHVLRWADEQAMEILCGAADEPEPLPEVVTEETARLALDLWTSFFWPSIVRSYAMARTQGGEKDVLDLAALVRKSLREGKTAFTATEAAAAINRFRGEGRAKLEAAAATLEGKGWLRRKDRTGGAAWEINPALGEAA